MFENNHNNVMSGVPSHQTNPILNNYESLGGNTRGFNRINANRFTQTAKLISTRKTDLKQRSIMPKTAINYYNLRKGLYLKNSGRGGNSTSRQKNNMTGSHDQNIAKSVGILNAYGELANMTPHDQEIGGGISSQLNIFHRNQNRNGSQSMGLNSMTSPKMLMNTNELQGMMPLTPQQIETDTGMIQVD